MKTQLALTVNGETWDVVVPVAAAGAAVLLTVSLGLALPNAGYPLLTAAATGSVWFAASRSARVRLDDLRMEPLAEDDQGRAGQARGRRRRGRLAMDASEPAAATVGDEIRGPLAGGPLAGDRGPDGRSAVDPAALAVDGNAAGPELALPATGSREAPGARVASQLFGLIAIYTLADGGGADFDRLAEQIVEAVHRNEPDTLLFIVHTVPKAPLQRIFYEVYRDRVAYSEHRRQPDVEEFFARNRPYVLATNVIELDLRYAKASALPSLAAMFGSDNGR